jgi:hypothetical protein
MRKTSHRLAAALALLAFVASAVCACKTAELVPAGGECSLATDCQPGLVCLGKPDGTRTCESDLSAVTNPVPPNMRDGAAEAEAPRDGATDAPRPPDDATIDTSRPDTSVPDTSVPDAADAATG